MSKEQRHADMHCKESLIISELLSKSNADSAMQAKPSKRSYRINRTTLKALSAISETNSHVSAAETPPSRHTGPISQRPRTRTASTFSTTGPDCHILEPPAPAAPPAVLSLRLRLATTRLTRKILARLLPVARDGVNAVTRL